MSDQKQKLLSGEVLEEDIELTLAELCQACHVTTDDIIELVEYGVVEPRGPEPARWRFRGVSVQRIRSARRLKRDLGVNAAGAALALDLLEEIERMRSRLYRFEDW